MSKIAKYLAVLSMGLLAFACTDTRNVQEETIRMKMKEFVDVWNTGNIVRLDDLLDKNHVYHNPPDPDAQGIQPLKDYISFMHSNFDYAHVTCDQTIVEGNITSSRWTWSGVHSDTLCLKLFIPAIKDTIRVPGFMWNRWQNGKIVETWDNGDDLGLRLRLGYTLVPPLKK